MGLFSSKSVEKDMEKLLLGPCKDLANETEKAYHGYISIFSEEFEITRPSARGLLKSRLFGVSFMMVPFMRKWPEEANVLNMMNACSSIANLPFSEGSSEVTISREEASSFAGQYILATINGILSEMADGPSLPGNMTEGFSQLMALFVDALTDSVGIDRKATVEDRFSASLGGTITSNLKYMMQWHNKL